MHLTNLRVRPMKQTSKRASPALCVHTASIAENLRHRHIIPPADTCAKPHERNGQTQNLNVGRSPVKNVPCVKASANAEINSMRSSLKFTLDQSDLLVAAFHVFSASGKKKSEYDF